MANFEIVWKIIKENNFKLINSLKKDLTCLICKGIMINASNAPCGCRYCCQCIKQHLNETDQNYCPGSNKYCGINLIDFDRDICIDRSINIRISQLTVKCPMETCEFTDELSMMEEHLKDCDRKFVGCPYSEIGCSKPEVRQNEVNEHLLNDSFLHNKLLVEYVNNLRNEIEELKTQMSLVKTENICLIESLEKRGDKSGLEQSKLKEELSALVKDNAVKDIQIKDLNNKINTLIQDRRNDEISGQMKELQEKQEKVSENLDLLQNSNEVVSVRFHKISRKVSTLKESIDDFDMLKFAFAKRLIEITAQLNVKIFVWKIENLSKVIEGAKESNNTKIFSDPYFVSENGYQMCLCVIPNGLVKTKGFFGVYFNVMKGPYDDILSWPCKIDVTFELINQDNGSAFRSESEKYELNSKSGVYKKPTTERNASFGFPYFIKLKDLLKQEEVIRKDQIFIKCNVCLNNEP